MKQRSIGQSTLRNTTPKNIFLGTIFFAFVAVLLMGAVPAWALKIGVVNMQRAVSETTDGKSAEQHLKASKTTAEKDLNGKIQTALKDEKKLSKSWKVLKEDDRKKKAAAAQERIQGLQQEYVAAERNLMEEKTRIMLEISKKLNLAIQQVAKRDGYDYIMTNAAVLWAPKSSDVTDAVIAQYNKLPGKIHFKRGKKKHKKGHKK